MAERQMKKEFTRLYEEQSDILFRFVLLRVSDREVALDITQDAFAKLWSSYMHNQTIEHARALLFRIARNRIIDWYRKSKEESLDAMSETGDDQAPFEPPDENAEKDIGIGAEARHIIEKIRILNPEYREAVYLRFVEDMKPEEIGIALGLTSNAVSIRITRGMDELRNMLGTKNKSNE